MFSKKQKTTDSGGFDLDAIGVIHSAGLHLNELSQNTSVFPNPTKDLIYLDGFDVGTKYISNLNGLLITTFEGPSHSTLNLPAGMYFIKQGAKTVRFIKE